MLFIDVFMTSTCTDGVRSAHGPAALKSFARYLRGKTSTFSQSRIYYVTTLAFSCRRLIFKNRANSFQDNLRGEEQFIPICCCCCCVNSKMCVRYLSGLRCLSISLFIWWNGYMAWLKTWVCYTKKIKRLTIQLQNRIRILVTENSKTKSKRKKASEL